jgi:hypothetical protein
MNQGLIGIFRCLHLNLQAELLKSHGLLVGGLGSMLIEGNFQMSGAHFIQNDNFINFVMFNDFIKT